MKNKTKGKKGWINLIISDIHSNLEAFLAVIEDAKNNHGGFNRILCLGDVVGYGPNPHESIQLLREYDHVVVCGNHDMAASGKINTSGFNDDAAEANLWTAEQLTGDEKQYLANLPMVIVEGDFTLVHASPGKIMWGYIHYLREAAANFDQFQTAYCAVGHTHRPALFEACDDGFESIEAVERYIDESAPMKLNGSKLIINPGSVGQPRDRDPRASYAIYDAATRTISYHRVAYDIEKTQQKIEKAGLPVSLSDRLADGE